MKLTGKGAAPGAAVGSIFIIEEKFNIPEKKILLYGGELAHLEKYSYVKKEAVKKLKNLKSSMEKIDPVKARIFDAHIEIVDDIIINEEIPAYISRDCWTGDYAIYHVYESAIETLRKTGDSLIAERAGDFDDIRAMLLRIWRGMESDSIPVIDSPCIIAVKELKPSDAAGFNKSNVLAILTEKGGVTSHAAIIAKSYGIPAVFGIENLLQNVKHGQNAAVDADEGVVILDPPYNVVTEYNNKSEIFRFDRERAESFKYLDGRTSCGVKIDIGLNIAGADEKDLAAAAYTDSVGVFRTEFLYMDRLTLPSEDEQFGVYREVLERFCRRPVIIRTLDIGGDKTINSMTLPDEDNPFLGNRALRFCLSNPGIFRTQIRACLRASIYGNLWIMLPMVASLDDIRKAKEFIASVRSELDMENISYNEVKTGIMIEIPSIALIAGLAAKEVDFASIGSNDLCQYLCAADRMNIAVESYYQSYHPAMFTLIKSVIDAFNKEGKPVSFCGELGSDPLAIPVLIGLGARKLSMGSASVAVVKRAVASITIEKAEEIAAKALEMGTAGEIEKYLSNVDI